MKASRRFRWERPLQGLDYPPNSDDPATGRHSCFERETNHDNARRGSTYPLDGPEPDWAEVEAQGNAIRERAREALGVA